MLDVMRGLVSSSLKTSEYLKFAMMTGCLRVPKERIFTGVNQFASYSVLDKEFSEFFGFTEKEVVKGESIIQTVTNAFSYEEAYKTTDSLWSLLLMTGYVTFTGKPQRIRGTNQLVVKLRIPNKEIMGLLGSAMADHGKETVDQRKKDDGSFMVS